MYSKTMENMDEAILVIDIGMTNKKVAVYSKDLELLDSSSKTFDAVKINGVEYHDLAGMKTWFFEVIKDFAKKHNIASISVTTHGATFVCLDEKGNLSVPCIFYTTEPGKEFHKEFYDVFGNPNELQKETFTPAFDSLINMAKGIYYLQKKFTDDFKKTKLLLPYPEYWVWILTGKAVSEVTSLGCHTYLWNQNEYEWSSVTKKLGIETLMPKDVTTPFYNVGKIKKEIAAELGLSENTTVTAGIHDSNASLLPYLIKSTEENFSLNSTGTWCVAMHPEQTKTATLSEDDIGKNIFFNRSAYNTCVKTSIFLGGLEIDSWVKKYQKISGNNNFPKTDLETVRKILKEKRLFLFPGIVPSSGIFPESKSGILEGEKFYPFEKINSKANDTIPETFKDEKEFFAVLDISMAIQSQKALLMGGLKKGHDIFVEGGFRKNAVYLSFLSSIMPDNKVYLTNMKEATSQGAALCSLLAHGETEESLKERIRIEKQEIQKEIIEDFESYNSMWIEKMNINNK